MIVVIKDLYTLKSWEDQDTESLAFHLNNKKIWDNCRDGLPYPYTKRGMPASSSNKRRRKQIYRIFGITVGGEAIGNIGFVRGTDVERFNAEVGYWISEKYWNQGIVSDALTEAIQYYFAHTEVIRIFATVYEYNPASMRVLEKAGFRKTGIFQKGLLQKIGQFIDAHHFELVADKKLEENQKNNISMEIRQLPANEYDKALDLSLDVFIECGRKDFDEEGLETFKNFIYNKQLVNELTFYGAFDGESLIGVIATKKAEGKNISPYSLSNRLIIEEESVNNCSRPRS